MTFKPNIFSQIRQQAALTRWAMFIFSQDGIAQLHKCLPEMCICIICICSLFVNEHWFENQWSEPFVVNAKGDRFCHNIATVE